ncbi:MAG: rod-binding protein [Acidobacteria bacterium]|nr:rod-binding protein [Acidobacteriota bacterium]
MSPSIPLINPGSFSTAEPTNAPSTRNSPENIQKAAGQFEALMIGQMLASMRGDGKNGWMGSGEDASGSTMTEFAEQEFAKVMAASGGFGLAKMVTDTLRTAGSAPPPSGSAASKSSASEPTAPALSRP